MRCRFCGSFMTGRGRGQGKLPGNTHFNTRLLGSGGRKHAIAIALAMSPLLQTLFAAPGNPGMAEIGENVTRRKAPT